MRTSEMHQRRRIAGLCVRCGKERGNDGTSTLCRIHANEQANRIAKTRAKPKDYFRSENGHIIRQCENCFRAFEWSGKGQKVFCDPCLPWFDESHRDFSAIDHNAEQDQARKVKPIRDWALNIIDDWQRQG